MSSQTANASYDVTKPDAAMLGRSRWNPGWAVLGLATIGLGLTGYLSVSAWGRGTIAGCGAGIACDQAMSSAWAWWLGVQ